MSLYNDLTDNPNALDREREMPDLCRIPAHAGPGFARPCRPPPQLVHVCFVCNEYPPAPHGGIGTFTQTLGRALVARGHRVTVVGAVGPTLAGTTNDEGVHVVRVATTGVPRIGAVAETVRMRAAIRAVHRQHRIDVLETQEIGLTHVPDDIPAVRVVRMHGGHHFFADAAGRRPLLARGWLERRSVRRADVLCAVSHYVAAETRRLLGLGERPIEVLPNPVDTARFCPSDPADEEPGTVLFAGTVCEKKGIRELVAAMCTVVAAEPHARLVVAGRDTKDPRTGTSITEVLRGSLPPAVASRVTFLGSVAHDAMPQLFARAAVVACPSHMEAQGLVVLEGLAMGKVLVVGGRGPGPEIVEDGVSGLLCNPHDPDAIAAAIITALRDGPLRARLRTAARARAESCFALHDLVLRNERFYERCLGERRAA